MGINIYQKICLAFLVFLFIFWIFLTISGTKMGTYNYLYSFLFGLIPFFGGIIAMVNSRIWGTFKSAVGRGVFFVGLGLFCWGFGENIWSYYNFFLHVPAPYPSLADIGFAPSIFFYGLGTIFLSKATGAKYGLQHKFAKFFLVLAPILILIVSYYVLVVIALGNVLVPKGETPLRTVLDIAYPLGDFVGLTISVIVSGLSFKYLGGRYVGDIASILTGLGVMYLADFTFSYTTTVNTYYNGDAGDMMLTIGMFLLTFGILGFTVKPKFADQKT